MARQQSFQDPGVAYHLWRNVETLYQAPLSDNRLQNICTCLRDDMDKMYGHFWQVVVNRTEAFGLATAHAKTERHVVDQHGVYRDGRVFCFNNIIFKCVKPSRAGEIYNLITLDARCSSLAAVTKAVSTFSHIPGGISLFCILLFCLASQRLGCMRKLPRNHICTAGGTTSLVR